MFKKLVKATSLILVLVSVTITGFNRVEAETVSSMNDDEIIWDDNEPSSAWDRISDEAKSKQEKIFTEGKFCSSKYNFAAGCNYWVFFEYDKKYDINTKEFYYESSSSDKNIVVPDGNFFWGSHASFPLLENETESYLGETDYHTFENLIYRPKKGKKYYIVVPVKAKNDGRAEITLRHNGIEKKTVVNVYKNTYKPQKWQKTYSYYEPKIPSDEVIYCKSCKYLDTTDEWGKTYDDVELKCVRKRTKSSKGTVKKIKWFYLEIYNKPGGGEMLFQHMRVNKKVKAVQPGGSVNFSFVDYITDYDSVERAESGFKDGGQRDGRFDLTKIVITLRPDSDYLWDF